MNLFALIGHPLSHSFSKAYFTEKFEKEGLDCAYLNFDLEDISQVKTLVTKHPDLKGFNVTIPYKEAIIPFLDLLDPIAAKIGAVNTVKVCSDGRLQGFNTDVIGFEECLKGIDLPGSALVLGTGGASKAVQYVLRKNHVECHLVSRDSWRGHLTYETLSDEVLESHLLIINATPVGMAPHSDEAPRIPYKAITTQHILFDLIYNPEETLFLRKGRAHGATTLNGLAMLHAQAEASWSIWNA